MVVSSVESVPVRVWPRYGTSRQALVRAMIEVSAQVGFHGVTVTALTVAAGVGPRTFYNHFADLPDVFFEACWQAHNELREAIQAAYDGAGEPGADVVAGEADVGEPGNGRAVSAGDPASARAEACVEAVIAFVQADPARAKVLFVQSYAGGPAVAELRAEAMQWLVGLAGGRSGGRVSAARVDSGGTPAASSAGVRRALRAETVIGGINEVLRLRIGAGELDALDGLVPLFADLLIGTNSPAFDGHES